MPFFTLYVLVEYKLYVLFILLNGNEVPLIESTTELLFHCNVGWALLQWNIGFV